MTRLIETLQALRAWATDNPTARRVIGLVAIATFVAFLYSSRHIIPSPSEIDWWYLSISAFVVSPAMVGWMGAQYRLAGLLTGERIGIGEALPVAILSGAANLLPIPGSVIIRAGALHSRGVSLKRSALASALVGVAWLGASGIIAGGLLLRARPAIGGLASIIGLAVIAAYGIGLRSLAPPADRRRLLIVGVAQGVGMAVTAGVNLFVVARAFGFDTSLSSAFVVSTSGVISAAIGIFPGGLGLREALAAALSQLSDMTTSEGVVAAAAVHLIIVVALLVGAIAVSVGRRGDNGRIRPASDASHAQGRES